MDDGDEWKEGKMIERVGEEKEVEGIKGMDGCWTEG